MVDVERDRIGRSWSGEDGKIVRNRAEGRTSASPVPAGAPAGRGVPVSTWFRLPSNKPTLLVGRSVVEPFRGRGAASHPGRGSEEDTSPARSAAQDVVTPLSMWPGTTVSPRWCAGRRMRLPPVPLSRFNLPEQGARIPHPSLQSSRTGLEGLLAEASS